MGQKSILFTPFTVGRLILSNRITMAPTFLGYGHKDGTVSDLLLDHYRTMAASGAALVVVENTAIHPSGLGSPLMLRIDDDRYVKGLEELARVIHGEGARAFLQINHAGRYAFMNERIAPSPVQMGDVMPREMTIQDIHDAIGWFAEAAVRAQRAGFDGVELHGATGYLLSEFVSPRTNKRTDQYGGTLEKRIRFPLEVLGAVMTAVGPEFPVGYRFIAADLIPDGLEVDEAVPLAEALAEKGIAYLSVVVGIHESLPLEPYNTLEKSEGFMADYALKIKKAVPSTPVITAGRIQRPETAEAILRAGKADLIALARVLFADPLWPKKAQGLVADPIVPCNPVCSLCMRRLMAQKPPFCSQWDKARREAFLARIGKPLNSE